MERPARSSAMSQLLVSVRSAVEAAAALRGGAALIDVQEPRHGSLGRADSATIGAVLACIAGRTPVSAALGEFLEEPRLPAVRNLAYLKWGLAGARSWPNWQAQLSKAVRPLSAPGPRPVAVAYADWRRADAPPPGQVLSWASDQRAAALLVDTWCKDGSSLLDWLSFERLASLAERSKRAALPLALAGALGAREIAVLMPLNPDWFAVRGAVCNRGRRESSISSVRVKALVHLLHSTKVPAARAN
jgi:uncharacterized protein (UPF0264 family)